MLRPAGNGRAQLVKASAGRWSKKKERAFLTELAAGATVRRACAAVGLSDTALYNRRANDPHFAKAWAAVAEVRRVRLGEYLVEAGNRALDPDALPIDEDEAQLPKPTIAEAIQIAKMGNTAAAKADTKKEYGPEPYDMEEVRARLEKKMRALNIPVTEEELAESGWWRANQEWLPPGCGPVGQLHADAAAPLGDMPAAERTCPHCEKRIFLTFDRNRILDERTAWAVGRGLL